MDAFLAELRRIDVLSQVSSLLGWDEQVNLPSSKACSEQRATQISEIAELRHREFTRPAFAEQLKQLEEQASGEDHEHGALLLEVRRDFDRATKLPAEFVAKKAAHESKSYHVWKDARERNDFSSYVPALEKTMQLAKEEAALKRQLRYINLECL